ncbi:MAG: bifunctional riboflavin kinase/FAD synthetase [Gammaproteobacteria bacterium]|nr:bifunctional riboflavin kinase/FAD synthetase [Gammaproteobacteria bacterium]
MEVIRDLVNLRPRHRGCVATIGNFDGVHVGHQAILSALRRQALEHELPAVVITFEPTPREFFAPESCPPRLTGFREKVDMLESHGVDRLLLLRFDQRLASLPASEFIERILVKGLGVRHLLIGDDFRFGQGREGDFAMLRAAGERQGFGVDSTPTQTLDDERVSSTRVRAALATGELAEAERLLGRKYRISGRVAHGDKLGRTIGFPTANLRRRQERLPLTGVFLVRCYGLASQPVYGAANVGTRPTVDGKKNLVEVHLFDFERDIYGQHIEVEFLEKLRDEKKFADVDALKEQIQQDVNDARLRQTEWQKREQAI